ncbi:MAG: YbbR-like domain-containing protein [Gemmatimonadota bacterium]
MNWKAVLRDNWPFKVAALVLAVLIWFNVSANQDRTEQEVVSRLEFDVQDENWVAVQVPREVRVTFRGRLGDILNLPVNRPLIRRTLEEVADSVVRVELDPSMVQYDRRLSVQPVAVRPSGVELHFERVTTRRVPVAPRIGASAAPGYTVLGRPAVQPESVTVRGGRHEIEAIPRVETERISLEKLSQSTTREVALVPPAEASGVSLDPERTLVTVRVDSLVDRRVRLTVRPVGDGAADVVLSPPEVTVLLSGPSSVVRELRAAELVARVEVRTPPTVPVRLPVELSLPAGVQATARADPLAVMVSRAEGEQR